MSKETLRSAYVDLVMKDATEEEKADASARWFRVLKILIEIAKERDAQEAMPAAEETQEVQPKAESPTVPMPVNLGTTGSWRDRLYKRH